MGLFEASFQDVEELSLFADGSVSRCQEWFGVPADDEWPLVVIEGLFDGLCKHQSRRCYEILMSKTRRDRMSRLSTVAHEAYHRVTNTMYGLHRHLWVDELLASLASDRIMRESGFAEFADAQLRMFSGSGRPIDYVQLYRTKRKKGFASLIRQYPRGFREDVLTLGVRTEALVGWELLRRLVLSSTWEQWLRELPADLRSSVERLLELDT